MQRPLFLYTVHTCANITSMEFAEIYEGQIRYNLMLEDVPIESADYRDMMEAIRRGLRMRIEINTAFEEYSDESTPEEDQHDGTEY